MDSPRRGALREPVTPSSRKQLAMCGVVPRKIGRIDHAAELLEWALERAHFGRHARQAVEQEHARGGGLRREFRPDVRRR